MAPRRRAPGKGNQGFSFASPLPPNMQVGVPTPDPSQNIQPDWSVANVQVPTPSTTNLFQTNSVPQIEPHTPPTNIATPPQTSYTTGDQGSVQSRIGSGNTTGELGVGSLLGLGGLSTGVGILGSLASTAINPILSSTLGSSVSKSVTDPAKEMFNFAVDNGQRLTKNSMYNAAGDTGQTVNSNFERYKNSTGNSAQGQMEYNRQLSLANGALDTAMANGRNTMDMTNRNAGRAMNKTMDFSSLAGGPASALSASASTGTSAANEGALAGMGQAGNAMSQGVANSSQIGGTAAQGRMADFNQQYDSYVKPYMAQVNGAVGSAANAGMQVGASAGTQAANAVENINPLKGLESFTGTYVGGEMTKSMLNPYGQKQYDVNGAEKGFGDQTLRYNQGDQNLKQDPNAPGYNPDYNNLPFTEMMKRQNGSFLNKLF